MRRRSFLFALPAALVAGSTRAGVVPPPEVAAALPDARLIGSATMRWFGLHLYDARLWSDAPLVGDAERQPLALELQYARSLSGQRIAERSLDEMKRIGAFDAAQGERWLQAMTRLFPDVREGDRLTGVERPGQPVRFFYNARLRGEIADPGFAPLFFGIWLSPRTSEPRLREQLLGGRT